MIFGIIRNREDRQPVHGELHLIGGAVQADGGVALVDVDIVGGDVGRLGGGGHGVAHVGIQGQVDDLDVPGVLGAQLVGNLVALEGDLDADAAGLGLELIDLLGGQAGVRVELVHHEREVVQQGVILGVLLVAGLGVQGVHVGIVIITAGAIRDRGDAELGVVRHVLGVAHADDGMDIAVLIFILFLGELLFIAHRQGGVLLQRRVDDIAGGVGPGAVGLAVGETVELHLALFGLNEGFNIGITLDLRRRVHALVQRDIHIIRHRDPLVLGLIARRVGDLHVGMVRTDGDVHGGGERLVSGRGGDHRAVVAGLARRPGKAFTGVAFGHDFICLVNGKAHPLCAGGVEGEFHCVTREDLSRAGGEIGQREGGRLLLGLIRLGVLLGGRRRLVLRRLVGRLIPDFGLV